MTLSAYYLELARDSGPETAHSTQEGSPGTQEHWGGMRSEGRGEGKQRGGQGCSQWGTDRSQGCKSLSHAGARTAGRTGCWDEAGGHQESLPSTSSLWRKHSISTKPLGILEGPFREPAASSGVKDFPAEQAPVSQTTITGGGPRQGAPKPDFGGLHRRVKERATPIPAPAPKGGALETLTALSHIMRLTKLRKGVGGRTSLSLSAPSTRGTALLKVHLGG